MIEVSGIPHRSIIVNSTDTFEIYGACYNICCVQYDFRTSYVTEMLMSMTVLSSPVCSWMDMVFLQQKNGPTVMILWYKRR